MIQISEVHPKSIVITGAANGLGRALARSLAGQGRILGLIDKDSAGLISIAEFCREAGSQIVTGTIDVTDKSKMDAFINSFYELFGYIDVLIANAGVSPRSVLDHSSQMAQTLMLTNYIGMINSVDPAVSIMQSQRSGGVIVAVTSISKLVSTQNSGSYSASKAAASAYLNSLRLRLRRSEIKVLEITLGFVDTEMNAGSLHAPYVMIDAEIAAGKILKAIKKQRSEKSIPFWRNTPWYLLKSTPKPIRDSIIEKIHNWIMKRQLLRNNNN